VPFREFVIPEQIYDLLAAIAVAPLDLTDVLYGGRPTLVRWLGDEDLVVTGQARSGLWLHVHTVEDPEVNERFRVTDVRLATDKEIDMLRRLI
jgi:hypothetical protein